MLYLRPDLKCTVTICWNADKNSFEKPQVFVKLFVSGNLYKVITFLLSTGKECLSMWEKNVTVRCDCLCCSIWAHPCILLWLELRYEEHCLISQCLIYSLSRDLPLKQNKEQPSKKRSFPITFSFWLFLISFSLYVHVKTDSLTWEIWGYSLSEKQYKTKHVFYSFPGWMATKKSGGKVARESCWS